jgi:hypothetical protein
VFISRHCLIDLFLHQFALIVRCMPRKCLVSQDKLFQKAVASTLRAKIALHRIKLYCVLVAQKLIWTILRWYSAVFPSLSYISCSGKADGGGAQIHACLSVMLFARDFGMIYVHKSLSSIEHKPADLSDDAWRATWNNFFDSLPLCLSVEDRMLPLPVNNQPASCTLSFGLKVLLAPRREQQAYFLAHAHGYSDLFPSRFNKLKISRPCETKVALSQIKIAVHLRRGDVAAIGKYANRYTSSESTIEFLRVICKKYNPGPVKITIFSQEVCDKLASIDFAECSFDVTSSPTEALRSMIASDVLLMSKSSMSYVAAIFCKGDVYYQKFSHPPMKSWITIG